MSVEAVINSITEICKKHGAKSIILFGSRATDHAIEKSDIDIAVQGGEVDFRSLNDEIERICTLFSFNIVDMSKSSPALRKDIESHGKSLYKA